MLKLLQEAFLGDDYTSVLISFLFVGNLLGGSVSDTVEERI